MSMLLDALKKLMGTGNDRSGVSWGDELDNNVVNPDIYMMRKSQNSDPNIIKDDSGSFSLDQSNPFLDAIRKSREGGPGVLRQLVNSFMGGGGLEPHTGTVGGGGPPNHVPGTRQDAALNPIPLKSQKQPNLSQVQPALPVQVPPDYSMPQALDPASIEELRTSLLTQAGQLDPGNPNGLSGRMNSPNSNVDQRNQMNEAQRQSDSLRGFDGSRQQQIKDANGGRS